MPAPSRPPRPSRASPRPPSRAHLEAADAVRREARHRALLAPLGRLGGDFRERIRAGLRARGHFLQPAHASVLVHLPAEGARLTELAGRAGVSKQAMGRLVEELVAIGYLERVPDPHDGRAKRVRFSRRGLRLLRDARGAVGDAWDAWAALVGEARLRRLRDELALLWEAVDAARREEADGAPPRARRRVRS